MRIAVVADIHGNLAALDAVLADIYRAGVDQIVCCGDIILGGPDDRACYHRIIEIGAPIIRGNAERQVSDYGNDRADPLWTTEQFGPLQYTVEQFSDAEREKMGNFHQSYRLPDVPNMLFYHGSPNNDRTVLWSWTSDYEIESSFSGTDAAIFVGAHNHIQFVREWSGNRIVVCGSVGATNEYGAHAQYILLQYRKDAWRIEQRNIPYDMESTLQRFRETGYIEKTGPIGRLLVRGLATKTNQVMPFLAWHSLNGSGKSLNEAVDIFLNLY